ncbi:hypothetical protein M9H77_19624 [Catharanthus roseus]|uniref:Uncharacterized protein n=1 Tax=Catharanthus roseus TaxID=4058 RepID=A0ACC0BAV5_CATRO|nr:hypothetical protein M9H77_19624 [Catharanthus roseus]
MAPNSSNIVIFMLSIIVSFSFQLSQASRQLPKYHHYDHPHPIPPEPRPAPTMPASPSPAPEPSEETVTKFVPKGPITIISSTPVLPLWKKLIPQKSQKTCLLSLHSVNFHHLLTNKPSADIGNSRT